MLASILRFENDDASLPNRCCARQARSPAKRHFFKRFVTVSVIQKFDQKERESDNDKLKKKVPRKRSPQPKALPVDRLVGVALGGAVSPEEPDGAAALRPCFETLLHDCTQDPSLAQSASSYSVTCSPITSLQEQQLAELRNTTYQP